MNFFLLDAGGAFLGVSILIVFMIVVIFVEAIIMLLFKLNNFGKCILDSFIVNIASLIVGFLLRPVFNGEYGNTNFSSSSYLVLTILFAVTVLVEGFGLILLNKKRPKQKIWVAAVVMNLVSYLIAFLLFRSSLV